jgi:hypothetical protein
MPQRTWTAVRMAALTAAAAGAVLAAAPGPATAGTNRVTFTNLALVQDLMLRPGTGVVTAPAQAGNAAQIWDMEYVTSIPNRDGFSSPYRLRNVATGQCLRDVGLGHQVVPVPCDDNPAADSPQLWDNHRVEDRSIDGREFYFRFNRASNRVLTARLDAGHPSYADVVSAPAEPISKGGGADHQLWLMRPPA